MKKLLILLFSILFFSSLSVFADNYIPTIEKIFKEKVPKLNSGERFYGCIYQIEWGDEDLFKQKRELSYVKIGNSNRYAELNVRDFNELFEGDEGVPNIGDCFAFTSIYHMGKLSPNRYFGSLVEIYYGEYKIDNNASVKELKNQITVDEYFQDNISYDTKVITLIGEVEETDVFAYEFYISLVSVLLNIIISVILLFISNIIIYSFIYIIFISTIVNIDIIDSIFRHSIHFIFFYSIYYNLFKL